MQPGKSATNPPHAGYQAWYHSSYPPLLRLVGAILAHISFSEKHTGCWFYLPTPPKKIKLKLAFFHPILRLKITILVVS